MTRVAIIGGGHNGLVAAADLAAAGHSVSVYERSAVLGGLCAPIEIADGYTVPGSLHDMAFDPASSGLDRSALADEPPTFVRDGDGFRPLYRDLRSLKDGGPWRDFIGRVRAFARGVFAAPPPPILPSTTSDFWKLGRTGLGLRRLGRADMLELMRVPPMCAADWVGEHFADDPAVAEWLASAGVLQSFSGPWSAGTAANLLLAEVMRQPPFRGGPAGLIEHLEALCKNAQVALHTNADVQRIVVDAGHVKGVELAGGKLEEAEIVLATCDPRTTFLDLVHPVHLPANVERQFMSIRARGTTAKLMLALDGPLDLEGAADAERAYIGGGSLDDLERAFDAVKYGEFSERPVLDVWVPSMSIEGLAPAGHHVVSILASFVPYDLRAGWSDETRAELQNRILTRLAECAPGVRDRITASVLWTPVDIEAQLGLSGGCLQHVEHALDQLLFMRPTPSAAHYETPIAGLFIGGSGSHPCGGITGLPGMLAAQAIRRSR